ncbi:pilin [Nocardia wallacei]|uniref:pilin n=1 Tax=Nocardia wallacei TaxID=480035 RepID=UPI0024575435|nr:pilin [Nocardia wallacei]
MRIITRSPFTRPQATRTPGSRHRRGSRQRIALLLAGAVAVIAVCAAASPAYAAPDVPGGAESLNEVADRIRNWLVAILATIATTYLTVGGARYLLSGGDAGEVERAKACLRSAMIGYCLAILAPVVVSILKSFVGG